jgi:hypothetical protein
MPFQGWVWGGYLRAKRTGKAAVLRYLKCLSFAAKVTLPAAQIGT